MFKRAVKDLPSFKNQDEALSCCQNWFIAFLSQWTPENVWVCATDFFFFFKSRFIFGRHSFAIVSGHNLKIWYCCRPHSQLLGMTGSKRRDAEMLSQLFTPLYNKWRQLDPCCWYRQALQIFPTVGPGVPLAIPAGRRMKEVPITKSFFNSRSHRTTLTAQRHKVQRVMTAGKINERGTAPRTKRLKSVSPQEPDLAPETRSMPRPLTPPQTAVRNRLKWMQRHAPGQGF